MTQAIEEKILTKEKAESLLEKYEHLKRYGYNFYHELQKIDKKEKGIDEKCHSLVIAMLLNAKNQKEDDIRYCFLKNFINSLNDCQNIDFNKLISDINVEVEHKTNNNSSIDILLYSNNASFVCVIENKIDCELGESQLKKYKTYIEESEKFSNYKYKNYVYLRRYLNTMNTSDIRQIQENNYQEFEYSDLTKMINDDCLEKTENKKFSLNIAQYKEFIDLYWYDTVDGYYIEDVKKYL